MKTPSIKYVRLTGQTIIVGKLLLGFPKHIVSKSTSSDAVFAYYSLCILQRSLTHLSIYLQGWPTGVMVPESGLGHQARKH